MLSHLEQPSVSHKVLLTFDDGPHPDHTISVLNELMRRGLRAIFFVSGSALESSQGRALLERVVKEGHFVGNHGYSHRRLSQLTDEEIRTEIRRTETLIDKTAGNLDPGIRLWRPPFCELDSRLESVVAALGYTRMLFNVDSLDWEDSAEAVPWAEQTLQNVQLRQRRGFRRSVCLFHDTLPQTAAQIADLIDRLGTLPGVRIAGYGPWYPDGLCLPEEAGEAGSPHYRPPTFSSDAVSFELGEAHVVARPHVNSLYVLNPSAGIVWDGLAGGASEADVAKDLAYEYDIAEDAALRDIQSALANWRASGLFGPSQPDLADPGPWPRSLNEVHITACGGFDEEQSYNFLDLRFQICFQTAELARAIRPRFANLELPCTLDPERAGETTRETVFEVFRNGGKYILHPQDAYSTSHASEAALAYELFAEIVRLAHPDLEPMAWLHSSLIGYGDGSTAFVGNSGSGKSTLAAALVSTGLPALSDDRVFLDFASCRPAATPNAIGLKRGSWAPLLSRYPAMFKLPLIGNEGEEVRFVHPAPPADRLLPPVQHVFFPCYNAAVVTAAIPLTASRALERITAAGGWISSDPEKVGRFLQWMEGLLYHDLPFSSLDAAMERIEACLRR